MSEMVIHTFSGCAFIGLNLAWKFHPDQFQR